MPALRGEPAPGVVVRRPLGVYWARVGEKAGSGMCEDATHSVYIRLLRRKKRGAPKEWVEVSAYACAVCWPPCEERASIDEQEGIWA